MLDSSSRISHKADEWNLGFKFNPSSAVQNHIQVLELGSNRSLVGYFNIIISFCMIVFRFQRNIHLHALDLVFRKLQSWLP